MNLKAQKRQIIGKAVKKIRLENKIPAVLYGRNLPNVNLTLSLSDFEKVVRTVGESSLFDLVIDEQNPVKVLINDFVRDPLTNKIIHADLYQVKMDEKIKTAVELEFVGESAAVKDFGGILIKAMDQIEIECLPGDLISKITVDISALKNIGDLIRLSDLSISDKVEILTDKQATIVLAEKPKKVEEEKPKVEVKKEGEEVKKEEKKEDEDKKENKKERK